MYCAHCGKKNSGDNRFCGFCGQPLGAQESVPVLSADDDYERSLFGRPVEERKPAEEPKLDIEFERDELEKEESSKEITTDVPKMERAIPMRDQSRSQLRQSATNVGGRSMQDFDAEPIDISEEPIDITEEPVDIPEDPLARPLLQKPVQLRVKRPPELVRDAAPVSPRASAGVRNPNTIIPVRNASADNMFMEDDFDAYDAYADNEYLYEEPRHQNFFMRHIRGIVGLTLLLLTLMIVGFWLGYGPGQRVLGQLYLSNNADTYITLGNEAEAKQSYEVAGAYFFKALELDSTNRDLAVKAANAYILAENNGKAAIAIERLIEIKPDEVQSYITLQTLYPDPASRPQKVAALIQQGYAQTGDPRLNPQ